jgi:hypothetical protein
MSQHFNEAARLTGESAKVLAARDKDVCRHLWAMADWLESQGAISATQARDTRAYISGHVLRAHYLDDPETYQRARQSGELDAVMENAKAADLPNQSDGANEERQRHAFNHAVQLATDVEAWGRAQAGEHPGNFAHRYHQVMAEVDPEREAKLRASLGADEAIDLDGNIRQPTEEERNILAGAHFMEHIGQRFEPQPTSKADVAEQAEKFMQSFVERRDAEEAEKRHPMMANPVAKSLSDVADGSERVRDESGRFVSSEVDRGPQDLDSGEFPLADKGE